MCPVQLRHPQRERAKLASALTTLLLAPRANICEDKQVRVAHSQKGKSSGYSHFSPKGNVVAYAGSHGGTVDMMQILDLMNFEKNLCKSNIIIDSVFQHRGVTFMHP